MVDVITEVAFPRPIDTVGAYAANPDNAPASYQNIKSAHWKSPKPLAVESLIIFKARFLVRELVYTYEIVEYIPGKKLLMLTAEGPFPMGRSIPGGHQSREYQNQTSQYWITFRIFKSAVYIHCCNHA
jgi:hypothetical protein